MPVAPWFRACFNSVSSNHHWLEKALLRRASKRRERVSVQRNGLGLPLAQPISDEGAWEIPSPVSFCRRIIAFAESPRSGPTSILLPAGLHFSNQSPLTFRFGGSEAAHSQPACDSSKRHASLYGWRHAHFCLHRARRKGRAGHKVVST